MTAVYGFADRLAMSDGHAAKADVESVLLSLIPGAFSVTRAAQHNDKSGTDWWVEVNGRHLSVDAKVRSEDWALRGEDDLALETWSVKGSILAGDIRTSEPMIPGWTRDTNKRSDYILWLWTDTGRYCLISFPMLCKVFSSKWMDWSREYKTREQRTEARSGNRIGWFSECVFVPRRQVWAEIYRTFAPDAKPVSSN